MAGTYKSPQKKYYWKNKDKIYEKTKEYRKEYNRLYYQKNKEALDIRRAENKKKASLLKKTRRNASLRKATLKNVQASFEES